MQKYVKISSKVNGFVIALGEKLSWLYLCIVLISVYEVIMRYAFNRPTIWVHETSLSLAAIVMVYGGLYAYAKNKHITVSVVVDFFPKRIQKVFEIAADIIGFIYVLLLTASTLLITSHAIFSPSGGIRLERSGSSWYSIFPGIIKISMSIFLVLFLFQIAIYILAKIMLLFKERKNV